jgi:hypothetical protein
MARAAGAPATPSPPLRDTLDAAFARLAGLAFNPEQPHVVPLDPQAVDVFQRWWEGPHALATRSAPGVLAEACAKMAGGALRIALALEYIW